MPLTTARKKYKISWGNSNRAKGKPVQQVFEEVKWRRRQKMERCLSQCSTAVKRHHGHSNSYKGKYLIGVTYIFGGLVHCHHGVTWWRAGRHGAGEVSYILTCGQ